MIYLDTSVIVAALTPERETARIQRWLAGQSAGSLFISGWSVAEVSSALAIKVRTRALSLDERASALAVWHQLQTDSLHVLPVAQTHFETAARFVDQVDLGLRAGDALHLAIVAGAGHRLATLDSRMAAAAPILGVPVFDCQGSALEIMNRKRGKTPREGDDI